jgi:C-terminal processing protease CtpA/Prc
VPVNFRIENTWGQHELTSRQCKNDLARLLRTFEDTYSYLTYPGNQVLEQIEELRLSMSQPVSRGEFSLRLLQIFLGLKDPHTRINNIEFEAGILPFQIHEIEDRFILRKPSGKIHNPALPILHSINSIQINDWVRLADHLSMKGSAQADRVGRSRAVRLVNQIVRNAGIKHRSNRVTLTLETTSGSHENFDFDLLMTAPTVSDQTVSYSFTDSIGILKIPEMSEARDDLKTVQDFFANSRQCTGIVIDIRGNRGGSRHILKAVFANLTNEPSTVTTAAIYKKTRTDSRDRPNGYLRDRFMFPSSAESLSSADLAAIERFSDGFVPAWQPTVGDFSEFHYLILHGSKRGLEFLQKPVIMLQDENCGSAADIFLGSIQGLPNVTTMGGISLGTSGRARAFKLKESGLDFQVSTMVSYQKNGQLFDHNGVKPDIHIPELLEHHLNGQDYLLECATQWIRDRA